jgi:hypothetical protein
MRFEEVLMGSPATDNADTPAVTPEERTQVTHVLSTEYGVLAGALGAVWSASLVRASLFLAVLSALGVALGLAVQAGGGFGSTFVSFAAVALPLALFLGVATFVRTVEIQREAIVYITGMNRIRHYFQELAPTSRPYFVLSAHDDEAGVYRSQGTGIRLRPPRYRLVFALVQTQGIVGVSCAALAAGIAGLLVGQLHVALAWAVALAAFAVTLAALVRYWNRSLEEIRRAVRPLYPTPIEEADAPI